MLWVTTVGPLWVELSPWRQETADAPGLFDLCAQLTPSVTLGESPNLPTPSSQVVDIGNVCKVYSDDNSVFPSASYSLKKQEAEPECGTKANRYGRENV